MNPQSDKPSVPQASKLKGIDPAAIRLLRVSSKEFEIRLSGCLDYDNVIDNSRFPREKIELL